MPVDFVRRLVVLRNRIELKNLAQFVDQHAEQFPGLFLRANRRGDTNQRLIAFRREIISFC